MTADRYTPIARGVAEKALGRKLPEGAVIHHVDEDRSNNASSNLVICPDESYHRLIHVRMRAMKACGNPDYRVCVICGKYDDPGQMQLKRNNYNGSYRHPMCVSLDNKKQIERRVQRTREWAANRNKP